MIQQIFVNLPVKDLTRSIASARTDQRNDIRATSHHPGDRDLRNADTALLGNRAQGIHEGKVTFDVALLEPRRERAEVAFAGIAGLPVSAEQPASEHAVSGDCDAEFAAGRQDIRFDAARQQRVFDLQVTDRMHGSSTTDRIRTDFRESDVAHISRLDHVGDRADRVLDRHVGIESRRAVDIDVVGAEALQAVGKEVLQTGGARVVA